MSAHTAMPRSERSRLVVFDDRASRPPMQAMAPDTTTTFQFRSRSGGDSRSLEELSPIAA
jgi:hypothetical protein